MGIQTASYFADQLSLDFNEGLLTSDVAANAPSRQMKSILFPKNMMIPHFGLFQRQVIALFAPLGMEVDFRMTRQRRLEMRIVFPEGQKNILHAASGQNALIKTASAFTLSDEEKDAFCNVMINFASSSH
jgi:hypothetical protein